MTESSPGRRAVDDYEIDDVFLVNSVCHVKEDFNQSELMPDLGIQHRTFVEPRVLQQTRTPVGGGEDTLIVRYLVTAELRVLKGAAPAEPTDFSDGDFLAVLKLTFAADYRCSKVTFGDKAAIAAFGRNAIFHVWPYWREAVHEFGGRMRLPRVTIPMMKPTLIGQAAAPVEAKAEK